MVIGHKPGRRSRAIDPKRRRGEEKFPTGALATLAFRRLLGAVGTPAGRS